MSYDYSTCLSLPITANHNAPLSRIQSDFNTLLGRVASQKLLLGIPFYGRKYHCPLGPSVGAIADNCSEINFMNLPDFSQGGWQRRWDINASVPYLINPSSNYLISYDDKQSIQLKCQWAKEKCLGGAIIWALGQDGLGNDQPLLCTVGLELLGTGCTPSTTQQLYDDFASSASMNNWVMSGIPKPVWVSSAFGKSGLFDNNGDSWYTSIGYSKTLVGSANGFKIESEIYMNVTNQAGCWVIPGIGITLNTNPTPVGDTGDIPSGIHFSLTYEGDACWGTPSQYRRHSYFWMHVFAEDSTYDRPGSYDFVADAYANRWVVMKIVVGADRYVRFYCDNNLIWTSTKRLHLSLMTNRNAILGFRSSGSAGKSYHDWVRVTSP